MVNTHHRTSATMKLEALKCKLLLPYHNHIASIFLKEHHWVISYALTSKTKDIMTNIQNIHKCLTACKEALWHNDFLSIISNLIAVLEYHTVNGRIKVSMCKILHNFQGCITFLFEKQWNGLFHFVCTPSLHSNSTQNSEWSFQTHCVLKRSSGQYFGSVLKQEMERCYRWRTVHRQMTSLRSKTQPRFLINALWC